LKDTPIDQTSEKDFERLLAWLGPDLESAAERYERVRQKLLHYFRRHGVSDPLSLADEVIIRITGKVEQLAPTYVGNPEHYFLAVARNVLAEQWRQPAQVELPDDLPAPGTSEASATKELLLQSLEQCWAHLTPQEQNILLRYYVEAPSHVVAESREQLARELGLTLNALRVMTHRLRGKLRHCIERLSKGKLEMVAPIPHN
jgi:RNA polymerase sigma factor (sigma-70 family)